jgi:hypothetical protein
VDEDFPWFFVIQRQNRSGASRGTRFASEFGGNDSDNSIHGCRQMMSHRSFIKTLACLVAFGVPMAGATGIATAEVVFGNLGNSGTSSLGSSVTDFGNNPPITNLTQRLAQGFTTGASSEYLTVQSITLGLFAATPPAPTIDMTVGIYANDGGKPASSASFTSSSVSIGDTGRYVFGFANAVLDPSTSYWIVPSTASTGSWVENFSSTAPSVRNGSGYAYLGTLRFGDLDEEGPPVAWYSAPTKQGLAVSITAVPEPSTYALAAIGAGLAGLVGWRRRKVAADAAAAG